MAKKQDNFDYFPPLAPRVYSETEFKRFDEKLQKYYEDYTLQNGEVIRVLNKKKFAFAYGATNKDGAVVLKAYSFSTDGRGENHYNYDKPSRYEQMENLLDQWGLWKGRGEFIEHKKLEFLATLPEAQGVQNVDKALKVKFTDEGLAEYERLTGEKYKG